MKREIILLCALLFTGFVLQAQNQIHISFEPSEGYTLDTINGQNGWLTDPNFSSLFHVSDEKATDGNYSLKGSPDENSIIPSAGIVPALTPLYDVNPDTLEVSADLYLATPNGLDDFEIFILGEQQQNQTLITARIVFYQGQIAVEVTDPNNPAGFTLAIAGDFDYDTFFNFKADFLFNQNIINYYVNDQLIYTGDVFSGTTMTRAGFYTNGKMTFYVDNIKVNSSPELSTSKFEAAHFDYYVNHHHLYLTSPNMPLKHCAVFGLDGKQILQRNLDESNHAQISLDSLASGVYIVQLQTGNEVNSFKITLP